MYSFIVLEEVNPVVEAAPEKITSNQKILLEQQMRQHVQILAQNFILGYQHIEYSDVAEKSKEYLCFLRSQGCSLPNSYFHPVNLDPALRLVDSWESKVDSNDDEVQRMKGYVNRVIYESRQRKQTGSEYIVTFPPLILDTILNSSVFIYPDLLPRIPFKSKHVQNVRKNPFCKGEDELVAMGLDQFLPYLENDKHHLKKDGTVRLTHACNYIQRYMMPCRDYQTIYRHIIHSRLPKAEPNAIKYFFENQAPPQLVHYVMPLKSFGVVAPCQRPAHMLPYQWKVHLYPENEVNRSCNYFFLLFHSLLYRRVLYDSIILYNSIQE